MSIEILPSAIKDIYEGRFFLFYFSLLYLLFYFPVESFNRCYPIFPYSGRKKVFLRVKYAKSPLFMGCKVPKWFVGIPTPLTDIISMRQLSYVFEMS